MYKSPFLNELYRFMMVRRYSKRTINTYITWIKQYIYFHQKRHPREMGAVEVQAFLAHLAVKQSVSLQHTVNCTECVGLFCRTNFLSSLWGISVHYGSGLGAYGAGSFAGS